MHSSGTPAWGSLLACSSKPNKLFCSFFLPLKPGLYLCQPQDIWLYSDMELSFMRMPSPGTICQSWLKLLASWTLELQKCLSPDQPFLFVVLQPLPQTGACSWVLLSRKQDYSSHFFWESLVRSSSSLYVLPINFLTSHVSCISTEFWSKFCTC